VSFQVKACVDVLGELVDGRLHAALHRLGQLGAVIMEVLVDRNVLTIASIYHWLMPIAISASLGG
jgi:hypothetical protein